jgi:hypothetical protein
MSLQKWAENGWLRQQDANSNEIKMLLGVVDRDLADAAVDRISPDLRFIAALGAGIQAAHIALRACGYRATPGRGQHEKTIESLELTVGASSKTIQKLKTFSRKRNIANYDMSGAVSDQDLEQMQKLAAELRVKVRAWLEANHPDLLR